MSRSEIATGLALTGMLLTMGLSLPQLLMLRRGGPIGSLSGLTWELAAVSYATWVAYGFGLPIYPQVPGNLLACLGSGAVVAGVARRERSWRRPLTVWLPAVVIACLATMVWGAVGLGWVAFLTTISRSLPQVWLLATGPYSGGVSRTTWTLAAGGSACWMAYALIMDDLPVLASTIVGLATALAIVILTWVRSAEPARASGPVN